MVSRSWRTNSTNIETLDVDLKAESGAGPAVVYGASKFAQLLSAHWWRRRFGDSVRVVAVSPGLVPGTRLGRHLNLKVDGNSLPDAKSIEEGGCNIFNVSQKMVRTEALTMSNKGARSLLQALVRDDFPADPEQIFLTSWGEWWPKDVYSLSLNEALQEKWCPSKEQIEKEEMMPMNPSSPPFAAFRRSNLYKILSD